LGDSDAARNPVSWAGAGRRGADGDRGRPWEGEVIEVERLTKRYADREAVSALSFTVAAGELFVFLGPNGAGKSSTIKMLTGQLVPTSGTARIAGHDIVRQPMALKRVIGYMAEDPFLYDKLTGNEFLQFVADVFGVRPADRAQRATNLLRLFELEEAANLLIETYSQGMRQKIALASVLIHQPSVLFLDEPTNGLDPRSARVVKDVLRDICRRGATVFMTTHVLAVAEQMCDRVAILNDGRLVSLGTMAELRLMVGMPTATLEDVFLHLTGAAHYQDVGLYAAANA
jgi:ABC-2 type transport system ATP-binding protein